MPEIKDQVALISEFVMLGRPSSTDLGCTLSDRISSTPQLFLLTTQILQTKETVCVILTIHFGIIQSIMLKVRAIKTIVKSIQIQV